MPKPYPVKTLGSDQKAVRCWPLLSFILLGSLMYLSDLKAAQSSQPQASRSQGERIYQSQCIACHSGALKEAPLIDALKLYTPERIVEALSTGVMSTQGIPLSKQDKVDVAYYLTGKTIVPEKPKQLVTFACKTNSLDPGEFRGDRWNGWGKDLKSSRFQSAEKNLTPQSIKQLKLQWAYAFPDTTRVRAQPTVIGNTLFIGSQDGVVYAMNAESGCVHWVFKADAEVRGGIQVDTNSAGTPSTLYFGDFKASAYAISAINGKLKWKTKVRNHPLATITGSVTASGDKVFVPTSSSEVISAAREDYACCTFRGALVALNKNTGEKIWTSYTTAPPSPTKPNDKGVMQLGPSGAPIWSRPAIDEKRQLVYVTTGQNYSSPANLNSDAVIAISIQDGAIRWSTQVTKDDAWNGGCVRNNSNCPDEDGPDFDIGTGAMLVTHSSGKELLLIGQKSGMVYALDPADKGQIIWQTRVGKGGTMGGVHWGLASDNQQVFVGVSDLPTNNPYTVGEAYPGLAALDLLSGKINWRKVLPNVCPEGVKFNCFQGISAAVSASPGLVYAGGLDGMFRVFEAKSGKTLWSYNTWREYTSVNGPTGNGGAIESDGAVIVDSKVFITSGYDKWGEIPGNVLLMFSLPNHP